MSESAPCFTFSTRTPDIFSFLLQDAVYLPTMAGTPIRDLLLKQLALDETYAEERIQTVFFNGRPVDDMDNALLKDGDTLSLSAAMPGLVGAVMRRGGALAAMRDSISFTGDEADSNSVPCLIKLRLFNFLAKEMAESVLLGGVYAPTLRLLTLLARQPANFWSAMSSMEVDGNSVSDLADIETVLSSSPERTFLKLNG